MIKNEQERQSGETILEKVLTKILRDNLVLMEQKIITFKCFIEEIIVWEKTHNIVSSKLTEEDLFISVYDSIVCSEFIEENFINKIPQKPAEIIDAGAGQGFPGLALAILFDNIKFLLVESDRKKTSFLRYIKAKLGLKNVEIINERVERLPSQAQIITRAAFSPKNSALLAQALQEHGRLLIWATPDTGEEFERNLAGFGVKRYFKQDYVLPRDKKRSLLFFEKH